MRRVFIHIHIPKCGGTTVSAILTKSFGDGLYSVNSIFNEYLYTANQVNRIISLYPNLKCLTGHKLSADLPYDQYDIIAFTWVRDPIERIASHYFFHRQKTELVPQAKEMNLFDYTKKMLSVNGNTYANGQTKHLGGLDVVKNLVTNGKLYLFPLSKMEKSLHYLDQLFPNTFNLNKIAIRNQTKKEEEISEEMKQYVMPYAVEDYEILRLAESFDFSK